MTGTAYGSAYGSYHAPGGGRLEVLHERNGAFAREKRDFLLSLFALVFCFPNPNHLSLSNYIRSVCENSGLDLVIRRVELAQVGLDFGSLA